MGVRGSPLPYDAFRPWQRRLMMQPLLLVDSLDKEYDVEHRDCGLYTVEQRRHPLMVCTSQPALYS